VYPLALRALMRSAIFTESFAVTTASALFPVFGPHFAFETPLTLVSADCTLFGQPDGHLRPETSSVTVFSSAATASAACATPFTAGAAMAPAERTAKAAIMVILVFIILE